MARRPGKQRDIIGIIFSQGPALGPVLSCPGLPCTGLYHHVAAPGALYRTTLQRTTRTALRACTSRTPRVRGLSTSALTRVPCQRLLRVGGLA